MEGNSSGNVSVDVDVDEVLKRIQAGRNVGLRALYQGFLFSRFFSDLILLQPDTGVMVIVLGICGWKKIDKTKRCSDLRPINKYLNILLISLVFCALSMFRGPVRWNGGGHKHEVRLQYLKRERDFPKVFMGGIFWGNWLFSSFVYSVNKILKKTYVKLSLHYNEWPRSSSIHSPIHPFIKKDLHIFIWQSKQLLRHQRNFSRMTERRIILISEGSRASAWPWL